MVAQREGKGEEKKEERREETEVEIGAKSKSGSGTWCGTLATRWMGTQGQAFRLVDAVGWSARRMDRCLQAGVSAG